MTLHRFPFLMLAVTLCAAGPLSLQTNSGATRQENKKMEGLTIGTFPKVKAVLPGESFFVESTFENRGSAPMELPSSEGPSPFAYDLLSEKDRTVRYQVSQSARDMRRTVDIPPPRIVSPQIVAPGQSLERQEDLAEMRDEDFAPGKYLIRARYPEEGPPEAVSALSPFTVVVPRIESFSSAACGKQEALVTVYAHRRDDGGVVLLQREALANPREGVAFRRIQLGSGPPVQVAITVDAVDAGNGRWFGWLRDGVFEAASGWGNSVFDRLKPTPIGAPDTVLLSPGFQVDVGIGLFGFVLNTNGTARLTAMRTSAQGPTLAFETELAKQTVSKVRWNYRPDSGFVVFWQDASGHVYRRSFDPSGKAIENAPVLTSGVAPLEWDVVPLGDPELITTVRMPDGRYFYRDLGDRSSSPAASQIPPTELVGPAEGMPPQPAFAFCNSARSTKVVMAGGGKVWSTSISPNQPSAWHQIGDAAQPEYLHAFSPRGRTCWAEWFEKDVGLRRAPLP